MSNLEGFLGQDLWQFVKTKPDFLRQIEILWVKIDWKNKENLEIQKLQIQSLIAGQIVPTEKKLTKIKDQNKLLDKSLENSKNTLESDKNQAKTATKKVSEELDLEDLQNLNLRPVLIKGSTITLPIESEAKTLEIQLAISENPKFVVASKSQKTEKISPKPPFITSSLQQAASSLLGMNPKITMQVAQKLYEGVEINGKLTGLITYMRTDSFALSAEAIAKCREFLTKNYPQFCPPKPNFYKSKKSAQEAHEAIRPSDPTISPNSIKNQLEPRAWRLYDLIWRQTMSCQMTDQIRERVSFELENSQKTRFAGSTAWTTSLGWKVLSEKEEKVQK